MTHQVMALIPVERPGLGTMAVDEYLAGCTSIRRSLNSKAADLKHSAFVVLHEAIHGGGGTDMAAMIVTACEERPAPKAILVVADRYTGWPPKPVGPRVVACLTQAGTAESVPKWIDAVVLNPED